MKFEPDYSAYQKEKDPVALADLEHLAHQQREAEREVDRAEKALTLAKAALADISEVQLPGLMDIIGLDKFVTKDGLEVSVSEQIHAKITPSKAERACAWLEEHNQGGSIKRQFIVDFDKTELEWAEEFEAELSDRDKPLRFSRSETVHHKTLSSILRELMEQGVDIPLELFNAYKRKVAKIKQKG